MKQFSCGSVVPGCGATFTGASDEAVLEQVARHAREDHGMVQVPAEVVSQVIANIR